MLIFASEYKDNLHACGSVASALHTTIQHHTSFVRLLFLCPQELEALVRRAAVQVSQEEEKSSAAASEKASSAESAAAGGFAGYGVAEKKAGVFALDKDVFWFAKQSKDRFRWNMLNPLPLLRKVGRSDCAAFSWIPG